jgi:hypothetical protein
MDSDYTEVTTRVMYYRALKDSPQDLDLLLLKKLKPAAIR